MAAIDASRLLRPGLLAGRCVLVAGGAGAAQGSETVGGAVRSAFLRLGAELAHFALSLDGSEQAQELACAEAVREALSQMSRVDVLVMDGAAIFERAGARGAGEAGGDGAREAGAAPERSAAQLEACVQAAWSVTRAVFTLAFEPHAGAGRIIYLAPPPGAGEHSGPARAGLENLARTLSIEWARHEVTAVTIAPGDGTAPEEIATLAAYLSSPAGAYFSGCLLDLRGPGGRR
jgi:NAD(P)-dependent dehydrogenase (short-subunit alcohol dehydrogenase family)